MESRILKVSSAKSSSVTSHYVNTRGPVGYVAGFQAFPEERFRSLQYSIPAVGHHYGNAFAPDEEDANDDQNEEQDFSNRFTISAFGHSIVGDADCENFEDDEEVDEDVEMSPAVEVISIDPNCDYDSEEEEEEEEENEEELVIQHKMTKGKQMHLYNGYGFAPSDQTSKAVGEEVGAGDRVIHQANVLRVIENLDSDDIEPELQNLHRDSDEEGSDGGSSTTSATLSARESDKMDGRFSSSSSSSSASSKSRCSNKSRNSGSSSRSSTNSNSSSSSNSTSCSSSRATSSASSHPSDYVQRSDPEQDSDEEQVQEQDSLTRVIERRKMMAIERRKRTTSINRKSFSLPQSPVAIVGPNLHDITSLSFEDLDVTAIVNELSPLKGIPVRASESDDRLVQELAGSNFDLASYITEDDFGTTDSTASGPREQERQKHVKTSPVKKTPKSRGKQLKVLRELMVSSNCEFQDSSVTRRSCTNKSKRIVEHSESETEESDSETDSRTCVTIFGIERTLGKPKRKDDTKSDPTWNPNGMINQPKPFPKVPIASKIAPQSQLPHQTVKSEIPEIKTDKNAMKSSTNNVKNSTTNNKTKLLSAGAQLARNKMLSLMAKSKLTNANHKLKHTLSNANTADKKSNGNSSSKQSKPIPKVPSSDVSKRKPLTSSTSNIKLDHDYCSPKKGLKSGSFVGSTAPVRKAIEIPFLLPTLDQLRQKKKMSKNKKRSTEATGPGDKKEKTGDNCDKSRPIPSDSAATKSADTDNSACEKSAQTLSPVEKKVLVKEEPISPAVVKVERIVNVTPPVVAQPPQTQPKQISLLKINQNKLNGVQTAVSVVAVSEQPAVIPNKTEESLKSEIQLINATSTSSGDNINFNTCNSRSPVECPVKVKKKLNLQEYKKRREHPADESVPSLSVAESTSRSSITSASTTISESISNCSLSVESTVSTDSSQQIKSAETKITNKTTPLDPISAAKLKALRMQQLKKEAVIKSSEAKILPKTVPEIVPLAEITSIGFDEHGNPIPYDKNAEKTMLKLHKDYEEIIIVSMGCNTEVTINPKETNRDQMKDKKPPVSEDDKMNIPKNELLSDIKDTIKRCQSSAPAIISSSSLISSIQEVVIKKKSNINNNNKTDTLAEAPSEKRHISGGQACQQGSPSIGVSPPNAFSPGKPEKAGGSYEHDYGDTPSSVSAAPAEQPKIEQHGEDKIIMHLRKDRQRMKGVSIGVQTASSDRFPPLKKLSPLKQRTVSRSSCGSSRQSQQSRHSVERSRDRNRRQYRRRRSKSSSSEHEEARHRSVHSYRSSSSRRRSRSRCSSRRSRSPRRRSRSNSYHRHHRPSSVSPERRRQRSQRRYYDRDHEKRVPRSRRRSRSDSSRSTSRSSFSSSNSRSMSRSSRSRSRSRSSSRPESRGRNRSRQTVGRRPGESPERNIVYVGSLEAALKREDLKRKFTQYGRIKQVTIHYKESGAKYGFVTFERPQDAYKAIDSSGNDPKLSEYDVSFGGRRAFCRTDYADLDGDMSMKHEPVPYIAPDGSMLMTPLPVQSSATRKDVGETFEEMLKKLKKEIITKKLRKS
ncbi:serine/arginine repetitive matrix protein 2-like [Uranotaenia lowii]|uniref:serine/arginine repetitive matrix protein 2-like n=1 Tax=Uranotaenia lowii TaxID=190385 RepID=UPI0024799555|nr:serine/arginine repetitive matrix protein 2-like [Uranotaenia lowii]XP_055593492.1 serine/arginine repetitive matrix protein 2-like [Uranotaenia lowii]XP_055593501.1 serine/arginine repetitive matrix protein 2-like [Uranotaenia lowii]